MALPGGGGDSSPRWFATISWVNSGESGVSTKVYFGGPYASPPSPGTLKLRTTVGIGVSSYDVDMGTAPAAGIYYCQVRHSKPGSDDSPFSPVIPLGEERAI